MSCQTHNGMSLPKLFLFLTQLSNIYLTRWRKATATDKRFQTKKYACGGGGYGVMVYGAYQIYAIEEGLLICL